MPKLSNAPEWRSDSNAFLLTIPDILSIGGSLPANGTTEEVYRVRAEVINVYNTTYGNMIIQDEDGNRLTVYGVSDSNGTRYDGIANAPGVGDVVILEAPIKHYYNAGTGERIIELFQSYLVAIVE